MNFQTYNYLEKHYLDHNRIYNSYNYLHNFDYKGIVNAGYYLYVTHIDIYYKVSAFLDDVLEVSTESVKMGKVSGEFKQVIAKKDGTICAEATVTWACVSKDGRPSRIPEEFLVPGLIPEKN